MSPSPPPPVDTSFVTLESKEVVEYKGAPIIESEPERWGHLCSLGVLDTNNEARFDDITKLCTVVFKVPIALVSLVDKERQWFKSVQGLPGNQTDRRSSFCAWTLLPTHPEVLVVPDAILDARFKYNPLVVGDPLIRFYAGCPLVGAGGHRLGSLCIIDREPRALGPDMLNLLANFAEMVVRELERDKMLHMERQRSVELSHEKTQLLRAIDCFNESMMLLNLGLPEWPVMHVNRSWETEMGLLKDEVVSHSFWEMFQTDQAHDATLAACMDAVGSLENFEMSVRNKGERPRPWQLQFRCASHTTMDAFMPLIGIPTQPTPASSTPVTYYFVRVGRPTSRNGERLLSTSLRSARSSAASVCMSVLPNVAPSFPEVKLGPLLGLGAFGRVYRGQWNGAKVAVKVIEHVEEEDGETCVEPNSEPFPALEALLVRELAHPNVVQMFKYHTRQSGTDISSGRRMLETWLLLEFCPKGSLTDALERGEFRKPQSVFETDLTPVVATALEVAGALQYLHSHNLLHGDLTSNNILLANSDRDRRGFTAKVADFGLSRVLDLEAEHITTQTFGTVTHMPPELLMEGVMSKAADVFAFGMVLMEMYTGQRVFVGQSQASVTAAITTGRLPSPPGGTPPAFAALVKACLSTDPHSRPTFESIVTTLAEMQEHL